MKTTLKLVFGFLVLLPFFFYFKNDPSQSYFFLRCPLYSMTGLHCPVCGSQRAFHKLLQGNILDSLHNNILFLAGLGFILYFFVREISNNASVGNESQSIKMSIKLWPLLGILLAFFILRNIPLWPFTLLAPIE